MDQPRPSLARRLGLHSRQSKVGKVILASMAYFVLVTVVSPRQRPQEFSIQDTPRTGLHSEEELSAPHEAEGSPLEEADSPVEALDLLQRLEGTPRDRSPRVHGPRNLNSEEWLHDDPSESRDSPEALVVSRSLLSAASRDQQLRPRYGKRVLRETAEQDRTESVSSEADKEEKAERENEEKEKEERQEKGHSNEEESRAAEPTLSSTSSSTSSSTLEGNQTAGICAPPAIEQFPRPLMGQSTRAGGGLMLHIFATMYLFVAIAIVCDEFFVPSLEMICDRLDMSEDVAGATFMAAGSSAPELATSVIAVFVAKDDIGISGVIGSAVFNIMFVISVCALFAGTEVCVSWWPVVRDCACYCISICALLLAIHNEAVKWYEALFLLALYAGYCYLMVHNKALEAWAHTLNVPFKTAPSREEKNSLFGVKSPPVPAGDPQKTADGGAAETSAVEGEDLPAQPAQPRPAPVQEVDAAQPQMMAPTMKDEDFSPWQPPLGVWERFYWGFTLPLVAIHYVTVPDCRRVGWQNWFLVTFTMSMVWISLYSYIMVWMITIIGFTMGIPDTVMGLTLIAVGVSVPDAVSSLCVAKQGFGDMAVTNAIGSNVFDILLCLGLPWFLKTAVTAPGSVVPVESRGLTYSTVSLFSTVVFLIAALQYNGWRLDPKLGVMLMLWYLFFMVFASLYELNVFGDFNPRTCPSEY